MEPFRGRQDPGKVLRWIIQETSKVSYTSRGKPLPAEAETSSGAAAEVPTASGVAVESLKDLDPKEREKWMSVILGDNPDILANRKALEQTIQCLTQLAFDTQCTIPVAFVGDSTALGSEKVFAEMTDDEKVTAKSHLILDGLETMQHLADKNEVVFVKRGGVPLLLHFCSAMFSLRREWLKVADTEGRDARDIAIQRQSCVLLRDITQNNPSLQAHVFSLNGAFVLVTALRQACCDSLSERRANALLIQKLWSVLSACIVLNNPNMNAFLAEKGYDILTDRLSHIQDNKLILSECSVICRLLEYMFGSWSDGLDPVFEVMDIWPVLELVLAQCHGIFFTLSTFLRFQKAKAKRRVASKSSAMKPTVISVSSDMLETEDKLQLVLEMVRDLSNGFSEFMKRDGKCRRRIICNESLLESLKQLNDTLRRSVDEAVTGRGAESILSGVTGKYLMDVVCKRIGDEHIDGGMHSMLSAIDAMASIFRQVNRYHSVRNEQIRYSRWTAARSGGSRLSAKGKKHSQFKRGKKRKKAAATGTGAVEHKPYTYQSVKPATEGETEALLASVSVAIKSVGSDQRVDLSDNENDDAVTTSSVNTNFDSRALMLFEPSGGKLKAE